MGVQRNIVLLCHHNTLPQVGQGTRIVDLATLGVADGGGGWHHHHPGKLRGLVLTGVGWQFACSTVMLN